MDARAYRLPELQGRRVFELDVKPVLEYKAGVLASVGAFVGFLFGKGRAHPLRGGSLTRSTHTPTRVGRRPLPPAGRLGAAARLQFRG